VVLCNAYYEYMEKGSLSGSEEKVTIRVVRVGDAETVALLSASLGYPASAGDMRSRIEELAYDKDRMVFVAVLQDVLVGWADAAVERHLQSKTVVVLGGLVVRADMRGRRIGQQLCHAVEQWALRIEVATVRVRSQVKRSDAHRFYLRDGYTQVKTSAVFEKSVF
jgi:GNAT superfamily N-acetyltransferase